MRVSTSQVFRSGVDNIQRSQQDLSRTQLQLGSGKQILSPADDPSGAVQSLQLASAVEKLEQYERNGLALQQRLQSSETVLTSVVDGLQRVRELAVQGNNGSQTNETRAIIAGEIRQALDELFQLANSRDANGEYLFAGLSSLTEPFARVGNGDIAYLGDEGQRAIRISAVRTVPLGDAGSRVFVDIPNGNGTLQATDSADNAGTGVISVDGLFDTSAWTNDEYTIGFATNTAGQLVYFVEGSSSGPVVPASGNVDDAPVYVSGQAIAFDGARVTIQGSPEPGDQFTVAPSGKQDLFATYRELAVALEAPVSDGASRARLNNAMNRGLLDLDQGLGRLLEIQTSLGARMKSTETQSRVNEDQLLQLRTALSEIQDLDYAEAISRFNLQQTALQAAQQTFVQVQRLSLFNFL